jgi:ribosome biogenesis protein Tsr3
MPSSIADIEVTEPVAKLITIHTSSGDRHRFNMQLWKTDYDTKNYQNIISFYRDMDLNHEHRTEFERKHIAAIETSWIHIDDVS